MDCCCIHAANLIYLASYTVRDMFWLRVLTIGGLVLGIAFFAVQPAPMWTPIGWHIVFAMSLTGRTTTGSTRSWCD